MLHVINRIKYDKIVYDQRKYNHEKFDGIARS